MIDPSKINRPVTTVNKDAWFLRFYLWLWAADVKKVDFCRLFWGYVFAVPFFLIRFLILVPIFAIADAFMYMKRTGIWKIFDGVEWFFSHTIFPPIRWAYTGLKKLIPQGHLDNKKPRRRKELAFASSGPLRPYSRPKPSKVAVFFKTLRTNGGEVFLSSVGKTADKGVEFAQVSWPYVKWLFIVIGAVIAAMIAAVCGYLLWILAGVMPVILGAIWIALSATASAIVWFFTTIFSSQYVWIVPLVIIGIIGLSVLIAAIINSRPIKKTGNKAKEKTLGFGGAMKMGAKSVKYRTCPVIKVEGE